MENKLFTTFYTDEGTKIVSKSSIAIMEEQTNKLSYKITLKEKNSNGDNISFETNIDHKTILLKFQDD